MPVDVSSILLADLLDASFASNADLTSQLGYVVMLADASEQANILHHLSVKSKRVVRSVLAAVLFAAIHAFYYVSSLKTTLNKIFGFQYQCTCT